MRSLVRASDRGRHANGVVLALEVHFVAAPERLQDAQALLEPRHAHAGRVHRHSPRVVVGPQPTGADTDVEPSVDAGARPHRAYGVDVEIELPPVRRLRAPGLELEDEHAVIERHDTVDRAANEPHVTTGLVTEHDGHLEARLR